MAKTLYALLVGIDKYKSPVSPLAGCVNDIGEMEDFLRGRAGADGSQVEILALRDEQATRKAVIEGFTKHLAKAGTDDVALFVYAGHGSQEAAPEPFWAVEPDRLNETLVLYDSRQKNVFDLADKELSILIDRVAKKVKHFAVILDCCHSGSATRGPVERRAPTDNRIRPMTSYLEGVETVLEGPIRIRGFQPASGWEVGAAGRHVLMAACRDEQTAKEYDGDGKRRGAFSFFLVQTLKNSGGTLRYRDLFAGTEAKVRQFVREQNPQIEVIDGDDLNATFLDGTIRPTDPSFPVEFKPPDTFTLTAGTVHGIAEPTADGATVLALYPLNASDEDLRDGKKAIGRAEVVEVGAVTGRLEVTGLTPPKKGTTYKAVVVGLPTPRMVVRIEGEKAGVAAAKAALKAAGPLGGPSIYVREVAKKTEPADYRLIARPDRFLIAGPSDDRPLADASGADTKAAAGLAIQRLEHIARWRSALRLENPRATVPADAVTMTLTRDGQPITEKEIRLDYRREGDKWVRPSYKIRLKNNTEDKTFHCAVVGLSQDFSITSRFFPEGAFKLGPLKEVVANRDKAIVMEVPDALWKQGILEQRDVLKLIVSSDAFDPSLLDQPSLDRPAPSERSTEPTRTGGGAPRDALSRLLQQVHTRGFALEEEEPDHPDWRATEVAITTVRPRDATAVPAAGKSAELAPGVTLKGHAAMAGATAKLSSVPVSSRDLGSKSLPSVLLQDPETSQPFEFVATRSAAPGLSVLELEGVRDPSAVTAKTPLTLDVAQPLAEGEHVLPVAFDGEFYLPLGRSKSDGKSTQIVLERLPDPPPEDAPLTSEERSVLKSIRIYFQKVLSKAVGFEDPYPILAAVRFEDDGRLTLAGDTKPVSDRVAESARILLYVHGIIGETRSMVPSVRLAQVTSEGASGPLSGHYDLVLSFDYESLNTTIEQTARALKAKLEAVGLGPGHGKTLHVAAHSMGGLVSRWFIEREGGNQVVQKLVMLGTPNGGSPWPKIEDWAMTSLTLALNGLTLAAWPALTIGALVAAAEKQIDKASPQMIPDSDFLKDLAASPDPGIPYVLVAGDTALRPATLTPQPDKGGTSLVQRLLGKLSPGKALVLAANQVFFHPNDIAVSVASMTSLGAARTPPMKILPAACDHMSYFFDPAGLAALAAALTGPDKAKGK